MLYKIAEMIAEGLSFGECLKVAMKSTGLTVSKLSQLSGVPKSTIYKILQGENPRYETLSKILSAFRERRRFVALIAARYVVEELETMESVKVYPASSLEEAIVAAVRAEKEGAAAIVCAPIISGLVEKLVDVPVLTIRPRNSVRTALEQALRKVGERQ